MLNLTTNSPNPFLITSTFHPKSENQEVYNPEKSEQVIPNLSFSDFYCAQLSRLGLGNEDGILYPNFIQTQLPALNHEEKLRIQNFLNKSFEVKGQLKETIIDFGIKTSIAEILEFFLTVNSFEIELAGSAVFHLLGPDFLKRAFIKNFGQEAAEKLLTTNLVNEFVQRTSARPKDFDIRIWLPINISAKNIRMFGEQLIPFLSGKIQAIPNEMQLEKELRSQNPILQKFNHRLTKHDFIKQLIFNKFKTVDEGFTRYHIASIGDRNEWNVEFIIACSLKRTSILTYQSLAIPLNSILKKKSDDVFIKSANGNGIQTLSDQVACLAVPPQIFSQNDRGGYQIISDLTKADEADWPLLMTAYAKGLRCPLYDVERDFLILFLEKASLSKPQNDDKQEWIENIIIRFLKMSFCNHLKNPYQALALTFKACLSVFYFQNSLEPNRTCAKICDGLKQYYSSMMELDQTHDFPPLLAHALKKRIPIELLVSIMNIAGFINLNGVQTDIYSGKIRYYLTKSNGKPAIEIKIYDASFNLPMRPVESLRTILKYYSGEEDLSSKECENLFLALLESKPILFDESVLTSYLASSDIDLREFEKMIHIFSEHRSPFLNMLGFYLEIVAVGFSPQDSKTKLINNLLCRLPRAIIVQKKEGSRRLILEAFESILKHSLYNLDNKQIRQLMEPFIRFLKNPLTKEIDLVLALVSRLSSIGKTLLDVLAFQIAYENLWVNISLKKEEADLSLLMMRNFLAHSNVDYAIKVYLILQNKKALLFEDQLEWLIMLCNSVMMLPSEKHETQIYTDHLINIFKRFLQEKNESNEKSPHFKFKSFSNQKEAIFWFLQKISSRDEFDLTYEFAVLVSNHNLNSLSQGLEPTGISEELNEILKNLYEKHFEGLLASGQVASAKKEIKKVKEILPSESLVKLHSKIIEQIILRGDYKKALQKITKDSTKIKDERIQKKLALYLLDHIKQNYAALCSQNHPLVLNILSSESLHKILKKEMEVLVSCLMLFSKEIYRIDSNFNHHIGVEYLTIILKVIPFLGPTSFSHQDNIEILKLINTALKNLSLPKSFRDYLVQNQIPFLAFCFQGTHTDALIELLIGFDIHNITLQSDAKTDNELFKRVRAYGESLIQKNDFENLIKFFNLFNKLPKAFFYESNGFFVSMLDWLYINKKHNLCAQLLLSISLYYQKDQSEFLLLVNYAKQVILAFSEGSECHLSHALALLNAFSIFCNDYYQKIMEVIFQSEDSKLKDKAWNFLKNLGKNDGPPGYFQNQAASYYYAFKNFVKNSPKYFLDVIENIHLIEKIFEGKENFALRMKAFPLALIGSIKASSQISPLEERRKVAEKLSYLRNEWDAILSSSIQEKDEIDFALINMFNSFNNESFYLKAWNLLIGLLKAKDNSISKTILSSLENAFYNLCISLSSYVENAAITEKVVSIIPKARLLFSPLLCSLAIPAFMRKLESEEELVLDLVQSVFSCDIEVLPKVEMKFLTLAKQAIGNWLTYSVEKELVNVLPIIGEILQQKNVSVFIDKERIDYCWGKLLIHMLHNSISEMMTQKSYFFGFGTLALFGNHFLQINLPAALEEQCLQNLCDFLILFFSLGKSKSKFLEFNAIFEPFFAKIKEAQVVSKDKIFKEKQNKEKQKSINSIYYILKTILSSMEKFDEQYFYKKNGNLFFEFIEEKIWFFSNLNIIRLTAPEKILDLVIKLGFIQILKKDEIETKTCSDIVKIGCTPELYKKFPKEILEMYYLLTGDYTGILKGSDELVGLTDDVNEFVKVIQTFPKSQKSTTFKNFISQFFETKDPKKISKGFLCADKRRYEFWTYLETNDLFETFKTILISAGGPFEKASSRVKFFENCLDIIKCIEVSILFDSKKSAANLEILIIPVLLQALLKSVYACAEAIKPYIFANRQRFDEYKEYTNCFYSILCKSLCQFHDPECQRFNKHLIFPSQLANHPIRTLKKDTYEQFLEFIEDYLDLIIPLIKATQMLGIQKVNYDMIASNIFVLLANANLNEDQLKIRVHTLNFCIKKIVDIPKPGPNDNWKPGVDLALELFKWVRTKQIYVGFSQLEQEILGFLIARKKSEESCKRIQKE